MQVRSRLGDSVNVEVLGQVVKGVVVRETWTESVGDMLVVSVTTNSNPGLRVSVPPAVLLEDALV